MPAGIYVFYLEYQGIQYPIAERFDVRTGMDFLLESCFQLDLTNQAAELLQDCSSGVYAESQVVSLGPHRMYRPLPNPLTQEVAGTAAAQAGIVVDHAGVDCIAEDQHSMLSSVIQPEDQVQSARIYFRAAQHPDFYYVVMQQGLITETGTVTQPNGEVFTGILPIPGPDTEQVIYYIEAVDPDFNMAQSQEHDPDVTDLDNCKRRDPGAAYYTGQDPGSIVGEMAVINNEPRSATIVLREGAIVAEITPEIFLDFYNQNEAFRSFVSDLVESRMKMNEKINKRGNRTNL